MEKSVNYILAENNWRKDITIERSLTLSGLSIGSTLQPMFRCGYTRQATGCSEARTVSSIFRCRADRLKAPGIAGNQPPDDACRHAWDKPRQERQTVIAGDGGQCIES